MMHFINVDFKKSGQSNFFQKVKIMKEKRHVEEMFFNDKYF